MSPRGRQAARPAEPHHRPAVLATGSLVVEHRDRQGQSRTYDFAKLPVPPAMQRTWAELFAARCAPGGGWDSEATSAQAWHGLSVFARFLAKQDHPPADNTELTPAIWAAWRLSRPQSPTGYNHLLLAARFLRQDPRLPQPVREAMAKRVTVMKTQTKAYTPEEFQQVRAAARRTFRAAHQRICDNVARLRSWRAGDVEPGTPAWLVGEALEVLATTGHAPRYDDDKGRTRVINRYATALGGFSAEYTWQRLYLSRSEAAALGVLLIAEFGLNATTASEMPTPRATPDSGEGGMATYRLELEKRRRDGRHRFETRNITDVGADSAGRLITQALEATAPARAFLQAAGSDVDRLLVWHEANPAPVRNARPGIIRVGPFGVGFTTYSVGYWAERAGLDGSPMRRTRKTVNVLHRREPGQNSQDVHDSVYVMTEPQVQEAAIPVIADGALAAVETARRTVLAQLATTRRAEDQETATADCTDFHNGPSSPPGSPCTASFLLCLACPNARITPAHHGRLALLSRSLENLRSVLDTAHWDSDWGDAHARLTDLKDRLGPAVWTAALTSITPEDRDLVNHLLNGHYDA